MRRVIVIAFALLALPVRAQDSTTATIDLAALRERGVPAEIRSKTTKRNPETGRSTIAMIEAYTKGVVADADGDLVFFLADDGDTAWIRPNAVALLEPADELIATIDSEGHDPSALRELNTKWFPRVSEDGDAAALRAWEEGLAAQGVPLLLSSFSFRVTEGGDVFPSFAVRNISDRTIDRITIELLGFSDRGDVVRDKSTSMATHHAALTGTVRPGDTALFSYGETPIWSNRSTSCIEIRKIVVSFSDATNATIDYQLKNARLEPDVYRAMGECSRVGSGP